MSAGTVVLVHMVLGLAALANAGLFAARSDGAGSTVDQEVFKAIFQQKFGRSLEGVTLADGTEVEHDVFAPETDGGCGFV